MFCPECGTKNEDIATFCSNCGTKIQLNENIINNETPIVNNSTSPINNSESIINNIESKTKERKLLITRKTMLVFVSIVLVISVAIGGLMLFNKLSNNKNNPDIGDSVVDLDPTSYDKIWVAFNNGEINANKYIEQLLYLQYDKALMDEKYSSTKDVELGIHILEEVDKYAEELSDATVNYLYKKTNLDGVTFELDEENNDQRDEQASLLDLIIPKVYAKENEVTNLNKAVLSSNKHFVVWYTTSGGNAVTENAAKKVAEGLEKTISIYQEKFGKNYKYLSKIFSKGKTYKDQLEILKNAGIDESYLSEAMQIYLVNYTDESVAKYIGLSGIGTQLLDKISDGDDYGSVAAPYILIKPSSFNNFDRLEQLYNHELFHHYQHYVLCGQSTCSTKDEFIGESTANWASSLASSQNIKDQFLNEWAETARGYANQLLSEEMFKEHSKSLMSYALFVYLNAYDQNVYDGTNRIIESIYKDDSYKYLNSFVGATEQDNLMGHLALKNLNQDYQNKNLTAKKTWSIEKWTHGVQIKNEITSEENITNQNVIGLGMDYYYINKDSSNAFKIDVTANSEKQDKVNVIFIIEKNGKFSIAGNWALSSDVSILTTNFDDYDKLYVIVTNNDPKSTNSYNIKLTKSKNKAELDKEEADSGKLSNDLEFETGVKNYKIKMTSDISMEVNGMSIDTNNIATGIVDELHQKQYMSMDTVAMGFTINTEIYTDFNYGLSYTSQPFTDTWMKSKVSNNFIDLKNMMDKFKEKGAVAKISDGKYKVKITKQEIINLVKASSPDMDTSTIKNDIYAYVYIKDKFIYKIEYDFSNTFSIVKKYTMVLEFSDYNNAGDVEIPNIIVNNATEQ